MEPQGDEVPSGPLWDAELPHSWQYIRDAQLLAYLKPPIPRTEGSPFPLYIKGPRAQSRQ